MYGVVIEIYSMFRYVDESFKWCNDFKSITLASSGIIDGCEENACLWKHMLSISTVTWNECLKSPTTEKFVQNLVYANNNGNTNSPLLALYMTWLWCAKGSGHICKECVLTTSRWTLRRSYTVNGLSFLTVKQDCFIIIISIFISIINMISILVSLYMWYTKHGNIVFIFTWYYDTNRCYGYHLVRRKHQL